jgi:hypothetical protein
MKEMLSNQTQQNINKKITNEIKALITTLDYDTEKVSIEACNLAIILSKHNPRPYNYRDILYKTFKITKDNIHSGNLGHLDYLSITTLLFCIKCDQIFDKLRESLCRTIKHKLDSSNFSLYETENILLFLDTLSCPYIKRDTKTQIAKQCIPVIFKNPCSQDTITKELGLLSKHKWFIDWNAEEHFDRVLSKKEFRTPY